MSDPLDEIISMSNDDTISKKHKDSDSDMDDDTDDDSDTDEEIKSEKEKIKFTETEKKKRKKINKKQMSKELQNNKKRQIKIAMPYSVNMESNNNVIDYNKSEEIIPKNKHVVKHKNVPFYEKKWFKIITIILITISCSLMVMFVSINVYKHVEYKIKTNPLDDTKNNETKHNNETKNNDENISAFENDISKDFDKLATNIKGGKVNKKMPKRDSKGRFVKSK